MKLRFYLLFFFIFFAYISVSANNKITKHLPEIERILTLSKQYGKDTSAIKKQLSSKILKAKQENNIPIQWAYNIVIADIYSMLYDNTNTFSDHYYQIAADLLKNGDYTELEFIGNTRQGYYNYIYRKIPDALPYILNANHLQTSINLNHTPALIDHFKYIAQFFSYIGHQQRAIDYLETILPFAKTANREKIDLLNSLGIYHKKAANDSLAKYYLNESLKVAQEAKDSVWIGIQYGNLSEYTWKEGKVEESLDNLKKNIELSMRNEELIDAMRSNLTIASYYLVLKDVKSADKHIQQALALMEDKPYFLTYKVESLKLLATIASLKNNAIEEIKYLKEYIQFKEKLDLQIDSEEIKKINWQFEVEKHQQTLVQNDRKQKEIKRNFSMLGIFIFLIAVIVILLIHKSKHKIKLQNIILEKKQLQLANETYSLDAELTSVKSSLNEFVETVNQNNVIISKLRQELANNSIIDTEVKTKVTDELNNMLKSHLLTQDRWNDFKKQFETIFPNYLTDLKRENPLLTENDLRILSFMKLDLTNQGMADLLGISLEGIKKAKQRLKKKIENTV